MTKQWTYGPSLWKDWCARWFGPDSDDDYLGRAVADLPPPLVTEEMVTRFLSWKLPPDFNPDAGITFKKTFNDGTPFQMNHEPSGTNLLHADQARAMLEHVLNVSATAS